MNAQKTLYEILQISENASDEVIRAAYLALAKKYHPDNNPAFRDEAASITKELNYAYSVLSNHSDRSAYDVKLHEHRKGSSFSACPPTGPSKKMGADKKFSVFLVLFCAIIVAWSIFQFGLGTDKDYTSNPSTTPISNNTRTTDANLRDLDETDSQGPAKHPTPPHGYFLWGGNEVTYHDEYVSGFNDDEFYAPFEIKPPYDDSSYLVKLKNIWNPDIEYQIFVKGGRSPIEVNILCGTYSLSYATGSTWYGKNDLFGDETRYYKSDESFRFYHDGRDVCGQSITLYTVPNGNLSVEEISSDEF